MENGTKKASLCKGEKIGLQVTKYLSRYKFPEPKGVYNYLPEEIIWNQINSIYGTWYTNEIVRVYYINEGGNLSERSSKRLHFATAAFRGKWHITHPNLYKKTLKSFLYYSLAFFIAPKEYRQNNKYLHDINSFGDKLCLSLLYVPMFFASFLFRKLRHIK